METTKEIDSMKGASIVKWFNCHIEKVLSKNITSNNSIFVCNESPDPNSQFSRKSLITTYTKTLIGISTNRIQKIILVPSKIGVQ